MKIGESKEDYLEAAYVLKRQKGYVRNSMLSDYLNYSKASVSVAVRGLFNRIDHLFLGLAFRNGDL